MNTFVVHAHMKITFLYCEDHCLAKGLIKLKADWRAIDSPKKRTDEFVLFAVKSKKQRKQIHPFVFWEKLADHRLLSRLTHL